MADVVGLHTLTCNIWTVALPPLSVRLQVHTLVAVLSFTHRRRNCSPSIKSGGHDGDIARTGVEFCAAGTLPS